MTAGPFPSNQSDNIRKLDISKDLDQVADLIEICFPIQNDPDGMSYIREMRKAAQDMRLLGWLNSLAEMGSQKSAGFVWDEEGKIFGNLSLIPFQEKGRRLHLIANVAVHPDHRRSGIARSLTIHALNYLRRRGDEQTWLQVRDDNPAAIDLYQSVGFVEQAVRTTWRIRPCDFQLQDDFGDQGIRFRKRRGVDWHDQKAWLAQAYPTIIHWNLPVNFSRFTPGSFQWISNYLDNINLRHWTVEAEEKCQGVITWQKTSTFANNLWLAFPEEEEKHWLPFALTKALTRFPGRHPLSVDYPQDRFQAGFKALGFEHFRTLIWMRCRLR